MGTTETSERARITLRAARHLFYETWDYDEEIDLGDSAIRTVEQVLDALDHAIPDHFVIFSEDRWTVEHSFACRLSGHMADCPYHAAVAEIADDYEYEPDQWGRWQIADIDEEGLPSLVRVGQNMTGSETDR